VVDRKRGKIKRSETYGSQDAVEEDANLLIEPGDVGVKVKAFLKPGKYREGRGGLRIS